jgi:hypothetical protein
MTDLVLTRFAGQTHFTLDHVGSQPRSKDDRWDEIERVPVPTGVTVAQAVALYRAGELKRPEPPVAREREEKRDRSWEVKYPHGPFPTPLRKRADEDRV